MNMINLENYKNNLEIVDKFGIQNVLVNKGLVYSGKLGVIEKRKHETIENRIPPLAATILGLNNTAAPLPTSAQFFDCWTDIDAQELYLDSKPKCYLILNKPGSGAFSLGEALSKKFNCIHLCPRNIINDEIEQGSLTGKCIEFNLKQNNVLKFDVILSLLKQKLESAAVRHRGYVISGFPLVTSSESPKYLINSLYSEAAIETIEEFMYDLICNMKKKKPKAHKKDKDSPNSSISSAIELPEEEEQEEEQEIEAVVVEEEPPVVLPKFLLDTCFNVILPKTPYYDTKQSVLLHQLNELFNLYLKPDIIIYLSCPDMDLVTKKTHKYLNYTSGSNTFDPFLLNLESELRWPQRYSISDYENPHYYHIFNPKYNCRQPMNFIEMSVQQMCNYKQCILPYLENKFKEFDTKNVIKLDARTSTFQMMHHLTEILVLLPTKPVLIPEPLYLEEPPEETDEFWKLVEELNVIRDGIVNFNRYPSRWFLRCPVELKKRQSMKGNPKFAVTFFKHVYLLSSLNAMISFCKNPRPYLKLKYLEPTCRVITIGTKSSGKTMISKCLSWLFDAPIICYKQFLEVERKKKYDTFAKSILSEIIATIEDTRFAEWQKAEMDRLAKLNAWYDNNVLPLLIEYIPVCIKYIDYTRKQEERLKIFALKQEEKQRELAEKKLKLEAKFEQEEETEEEIEKEFEEKIGEQSEQDMDFVDKFNLLSKALSFLPFLDDLKKCEMALKNRSMCMQYGPIQLVTITEKPAIPVLGDEDVTEAVNAYIVANDLQNEIEPTPEELMAEMINIISEIDCEAQKTENSDHFYGKYVIDGFPSDPEYLGYLSDAKLLPDYTIALIENREIEPELMHYYMNIDKIIKNYDERFMQANDPLIQTKLFTKKMSDGKQVDVQIILHEYFNNTFAGMSTSEYFEENTENNLEAAFTASFIENIEKFREDWDSIKLRLEENNKAFLEIELENKTDVEIVEEVLSGLRKSYCITGEIREGEGSEDVGDEGNLPKDILTYNHPEYLCETSVFCPIAYYDYGILWEGKSEFSIKYDNKIYYFAKKECMEKFMKNITGYQFYNKPYKQLPALRICVIGSIGSGKTTVSKQIAKEFGLIHIDFSEFINEFLLPKHFKKVGRQYENTFTDTPIDEEGVMEFQLDEENENLMSDILGNETEMRRMIYNYFERGAPILSVLMQKVIKKIWFDNPFMTTGFVLDGYPRLPTDVEDMIAYFCIPDLIIELESNSETSLQRVSPIMFKTWKTQLAAAKAIAKRKLESEKNDWLKFITKNVVVNLIWEELLKNIFSLDELEKPLSTESMIIDAHPSGSANVDTNLFNSYNECIQEYPEPIDLSEWEKPDEARERINARIESIYEVDDENIQALKDILLEQKIRIVSVDGTKSLHKVLRVALSKILYLRHRTESFFEQTFLINNDIAEMLLMEGFYFLSKFNRMCPVYIYENPDAVLNPYKISKRRGKIFTVLHRSYIYFLNSDENARKFRADPLTYIRGNTIQSYIEYPLRIAVIGPPKSGKTSLVEKIGKRYGLLSLTKGMALRYILENMQWSELASRMKAALYEGECINTELIIKAVQTIVIDHRFVTHGIIMDGFPEFPFEAMELSRIGLYPLIIFNISAKNDAIISYSQNEYYYDILKRKPPYSQPFIEYRFINWQESNYKIINWIGNDYQNLHVLDGNLSKWQCLYDANIIIKSYMNRINYYLCNVTTKIVPACVMGISNKMFQQRMSSYKNMCPVCLRKNVLRHCGYPVDKKGVLQYNNLFYWICEDHVSAVLKSPQIYLKRREKDLPEIPAVVKTVHVSLVYENGVCMVTYAENLPNQKISRGDNKFAANFKGKTYLFCQKECLDKFLAKPHMYCDIQVFKQSTALPELTLKKLPNLGYLEQTVGNIITDACCAVHVLRPKYPGLDIRTSALLYIALHLKVHNSLFDKSQIAMYTKALNLYEARCKLMIDIGLRLRALDNPFANYPKCCKSVKNDDSGTVYKPSTSRVPVPDERFDYLCEYHKPASKVPAFLNVVDIAGLVRGAAEGQGLGNAFLSHIKACDAIFHLCRAFDDEDVIHVDGDVNPIRDLETIAEELRLKDEEQLMQNFEKLDRVVNRGGDKKLKPEYDALTKIKTILVDEKKHIRFADWSAAEIEVLNKYLFLTSKPALYLVNLSEKDYIRKKNKWLPKLKEWIDKNDPGAPLIPFSGALETKLIEMDPEERKAYLKEHNITSALDKIIVQGYKALQLEYFFTAGPDEVKAWTIQKGTKAPQAAGRIHTDFEKGFIMAEVMHFKDFREEGTEAACKAAGKYRQQGRNYVVEDGDIIFFKFNAGAGLKDAKKK